MDLRILENFLVVAKEKNITKAAALLHISQLSLSKQMQDLEAKLGKSLFIRGKRSTTLTEEGLFLVRRAEELIALWGKTESEISNNEGLIEGDISIAGATSARVMKVASSMMKEYPNVHFSLSNGDAELLIERLDNGTLDFAILIEPIDITKYEYIHLNESDQWGILIHNKHPLSFKDNVTNNDLKELPLMMPHRDELRLMLLEWFGRYKKKLNIVTSYDILFNNALILVENNVVGGLTVESLSEMYKKGAGLSFKPLNPPIKIDYCIAWKRDVFKTRVMEKFIEEIVAKVNAKAYC